MYHLKFNAFLLLGSMVFVGCGGGGGSTPVNVAPVATVQNDITLNENQSIAILLSGTDANGDTLTYTATSPSHGTFDGTTYVPNVDYVGSDSFSYVANDGTLDSAPAEVSITVTLDSDGDNIADITDTDDDNDGVSDEDEIIAGTDPLDATSKPTIMISGTITYDFVPANSNNIGLDYANTRPEVVKNVIVELIDSSDTTIASTSTDINGSYSFGDVTPSTSVKVRVLAKMFMSGTPSWDVKVVDNTNNNSLYVMEGSLLSSGTTSSTRDLHASSGWGGSSYSSTRTAAPFAMIDDVYHSMQTVLGADAQAVFAPLLVNWSIYNVPLSGDETLGQITTSHYTDGNLFILGDADTDTDEYDDHVIAHEWGHYYEDKFSRMDSIGGSHGDGHILDIRVAFSEGWGNAFSGMALDDPVYFDTSGSNQSTGFKFDVETDTTPLSPGWYSESSIQRILYDLYDENSDSSDNLHFGFGAIHQVFVGTVKVTPAFTSIFTFIDALKDENPADVADIDTIVSNESIAPITDIYGTGRTNRSSAYPYHDLNVGANVSVETSNADGSYNKLSNHQYVKFTIGSSGTYTIRVQQTNGTDSDPDFTLYRSSPFGFVTSSAAEVAGIEQKDVSLTAGSYLLDIIDYNNIATSQFNVTVN